MNAVAFSLASPAWPAPRAVISPLPPTDAALVAAARDGDRAAASALFVRHAPRVRRVLLRVLGPDAELGDVLQDVFIDALAGLSDLRDPGALGAWLAGIAVHRARREIRKRRRWSWLRFMAPDELPEGAARDHDDAASEQVSAMFRALDRLPTDDRIVFCLRFLDGRELGEIAALSSVSLATIKRRLVRAEASFREAAAREPALVERLLRKKSRGRS